MPQLTAHLEHYADVATRCPETTADGIFTWLGTPSGRMCDCGREMRQFESANGGCELCKEAAAIAHFDADDEPRKRNRAGMPWSYCRMTWHTWSYERLEPPAQILRFMLWTKKHTEMPILLMRGPSAVGKTHMAAAVFEEALRSGKRGRWLPAHQIDLEAFSDDVAQSYGRADLLVIDDLRHRDSFSFNRHERVWRLIEERQSNLRPTIITTNLGDAELREWGDGFYRRLTAGYVAEIGG
jgi:hypothetical protein